MLREVTFPLQLKTPNQRAAHWGQAATEVKRTLLPTFAVLRHCFGVPPICGPHQRFRVELTRIAPRAFDEQENHRMAFKHVVDAIARWIGIDDADPRIKGGWIYPDHVRGKPKEHLVRLRIWDLCPGREEAFILSRVPGAEAPPEPHLAARTKPPRVKQTGLLGQKQLLFHRARIAHPDEQDPDDPEHIITRDWSEIMCACGYPLITVIVAEGGRRVPMLRREHYDPELGGNVYLYKEHLVPEVKPPWTK